MGFSITQPSANVSVNEGENAALECTWAIDEAQDLSHYELRWMTMTKTELESMLSVGDFDKDKYTAVMYNLNDVNSMQRVQGDQRYVSENAVTSSTLKITAIRLEDEGPFLCCLCDYVTGQHSYEQIDLTVLGKHRHCTY